MSCTPSIPRWSVPALVLAVLAAPGSAGAQSEEYLTSVDAVPPNILFLVDRSLDMSLPCFIDLPAVDTGLVDTGVPPAPSDPPAGTTDSGWPFGSADASGEPSPAGASAPPASSTDPCIELVADQIDQVTQHFGWAKYGVAGTVSGPLAQSYSQVAPLGSTYPEISEALDTLDAFVSPTRNLREALGTLHYDYFRMSAPDDGVDSDGDGFTGDWQEGPIDYQCTETHVIVITKGAGVADDQNRTGYFTPITPDVECDELGLTTGTDDECKYDNYAYKLYHDDIRSDLSGVQNVVVHTVGIGLVDGGVADQLFINASNQTGGAGLYTNATQDSEILSGILAVLTDIRQGYFSRSAPVVSADGNYLLFTYFEVSGDNPLAEGHVRAYQIDNDPDSLTYGQVLYEGPSEFGGALWDAGDLLVSRPVESAEQNPDDRDGSGKRDIYTFLEEFKDVTPIIESETTSDHRQGLDYDLVSEVGSRLAKLDIILDTSVDGSTSCAADPSFDLDQDGCTVDGDDLQALVDFIRGLPEAKYRYLDRARGSWKLGDSPHSVPVVVQTRLDSYYAEDPSLDRFYDGLEAEGSPDMVYIAANDGMLHAFMLEDDAATTVDEAGEEAWAWMPGYLLRREHAAEWAGRAIDMMLYGRTFLFDGTPVVEDIWVDTNGDGLRSCASVPDDCEWRRVLVVQQGRGGPVTLALDITLSSDPKFLWEQTDETDPSAMGYTVGRPVIMDVRYRANGSAVLTSPESDVDRDLYVALWGSGRAVPFSSSTAYYQSTEANLYMWPIGDDYWSTDDEVSFVPGGANLHPEELMWGATLNADADASYEYGYVAAALAAVDVDSDGDADTVYFPVTTTYRPTDEGGPGPGTPADPGSSWMYKACIEDSDPQNLLWVEYFDPIADGGLPYRPEVYYAATTSWLSDGALAVYWGSGTPYERTQTSKPGYFFAVKDTDPGSCAADTAVPMTDCGTNGVYPLEFGEGLTGDPLVFAGVVYFPTWVPDADLCEGGTGRIYGLDFENCEPGMDTNADGTVDSSDASSIAIDDAYISSLTVTDAGTLFYGASNFDPSSATGAVGTISANPNTFLGTRTLTWLESF